MNIGNWWGKLKFQHRLLLLFTILLTLAIGVLGVTTYLVAKQAISGLIEDKLISSAKNVAETVEFYTSSVDSREFNSKVEYLLNKERANYNSKGLKPFLEFVDNEGKQTLVLAGTKNILPQSILKSVCTNGSGVKSVEFNGSRYSMASQFIPGKNWYYVVAIKEQDYLGQVNQLRNIALLVGFVALMMAFLIGRVGTRKFAEPLEKMLLALGQASQGDLTVRVESNKMGSEFAVLGESFNAMLDSLAGFLSQILEMFEQVNRFNKQITAVAENQVQTVEQANSTVKEVAVSVDMIAREIDSSQTASEKMLDAASKGETALQEIAQVVDKNAGVIGEQVKAIDDLERDINKISNFMQLIQQISSQTHLLALNASIEAARAGDHGKGFAVVAQEVKKLADSSSIAANEVARLVEDIYRQSSVVSSQTEISKNVADEGVLAIRQAKNSLREISLAIQDTNGYIELITESVHTISSGSEQVVSMIQLLASDKSGITKQVSAKEIAALANKLDEMAGNLKVGLEVFNF